MSSGDAYDMKPADLPCSFGHQFEDSVPGGSSVPDCPCEAELCIPLCAPAEIHEIIRLIQLKEPSRAVHAKHQAHAGPMIAPHAAEREDVSPKPGISRIGVWHHLQDRLKATHQNRLASSGRIVRQAVSLPLQRRPQGDRLSVCD